MLSRPPSCLRYALVGFRALVDVQYIYASPKRSVSSCCRGPLAHLRLLTTKSLHSFTMRGGAGTPVPSVYTVALKLHFTEGSAAFARSNVRTIYDTWSFGRQSKAVSSVRTSCKEAVQRVSYFVQIPETPPFTTHEKCMSIFSPCSGSRG